VPDSFSALDADVIACARCPRLREHCLSVAAQKRRAYLDWTYWGKPVPGFGDRNARVLILGLAPGAHGSNRTGRPFTGDGSGNFLYPVLYETGFASQPHSTDMRDGMKLTGCYITSVGRCAPPGNKPAPAELANCSEFLDRELALLTKVKVVVVLGKIAFDGYLSYLKRNGHGFRRVDYIFAHGATYKMPNGISLVCSYHPSMQNTLTGKLTAPMFRKIFVQARRLAGLD